jgi:hypothetical protein
MLAEVTIPVAHRVIAFVIGLCVVLGTVEMIRRRKLREEYAMLWLAASLIVMVLAIFPAIPFLLQRALKVNYLTIVVLAGFLFLGMIVLHFATVISRQAEQIRQLAQRMAILARRLAELESPDASDADAGRSE